MKGRLCFTEKGNRERLVKNFTYKEKKQEFWEKGEKSQGSQVMNQRDCKALII